MPTTESSTQTPMRASNVLKATMSNLSHAKIVPRRSADRGAADHGWLDTKHTFSFAGYYDPKHQQFGSLRVLNEDRVAPGTGFPTHPHQNAEIFSYILSGELTHRDSMQKKGAESSNKDMFYRMKRGDVQFTTGGKGIAHSEQNEHDKDWVHFLQIWALPWKRGLPPTYHTSTFPEGNKRDGFVTIITPLKAGPNATLDEEKAAVPVKEGTIPVHADLVFSAGIIEPGKTFEYKVGGEDYVRSKADRKTYIHLPATQGGKAKVKLANDTVLSEGDGAYVSQVNAGDVLTFESVGTAEAEIVVLDSSST
jgi:quercetin 2,3-dioxygenase